MAEYTGEAADFFTGDELSPVFQSPVGDLVYRPQAIGDELSPVFQPSVGDLVYRPQAIGYRVGDWEAPVAAFSAEPTSGVAPLTVEFGNHSTGDPW